MQRDSDLGHHRLYSGLRAAGHETNSRQVLELWIELQEQLANRRYQQMGRACDDLASGGSEDGDFLIEEAGMYLGSFRPWDDD